MCHVGSGRVDGIWVEHLFCGQRSLIIIGSFKSWAILAYFVRVVRFPSLAPRSVLSDEEIDQVISSFLIRSLDRIGNFWEVSIVVYVDI